MLKPNMKTLVQVLSFTFLQGSAGCSNPAEPAVDPELSASDASATSAAPGESDAPDAADAAAVADGPGQAGAPGEVDASAAVDASSEDPDAGPDVSRAEKYVFVISLENHDSIQIYGNSDAPYLNKLASDYARATNFQDELPKLLSEPHYVWMEAGTNHFSDHTFATDNAPSASNSTSETRHLVTQLNTAGKSWLAYQEGMNAKTGACPIRASGFYQPKHDPFVFFHDVSGSPPSASNAYCIEHHRTLSAFAADLKNERVASYNFITPDQCHDMHGQIGCPNSNAIKAGDDFLAGFVPSIIDFLKTHQGVLFIAWDEGDKTARMPFLAIGPSVKQGHSSSVAYTHSSLLKTTEVILGVPVLSTVTDANTLTDMFVNGKLP